MKNVMLTSALLLGGLTTFAITSTVVSTQIHAQYKQDNYKEIKLEEVPTAVLDAVKKSMPEAVVEKAFVNDKKHYKLQLKTADKTSTIYSDAKGNLANN